jgi:uncharacterized protein Yka (UPF0111/DUF47 family)
MPSRFPAIIDPVGVQLIRQCDIARRASLFLVKEADAIPPDSGLIAEQITRLRQQSAAMKDVIRASLPRSSFIDYNPEDSLRLTSALDALIESIESCAKVLAVDASEQAEKNPPIGIACNLILQCVDRIYECLRRLNSDTGDPAGHVRPATVRAIESEITKIVRRHLVCSRSEKCDLSRLPASQQTLECIQAAADRCRDLARLLEEIYAGFTASDSSGLARSRRLQTEENA